jgi:mannose-1-phosphate guanylyltransferase
MDKEFEGRKSHWCIVIADDHAPACVMDGALDWRPGPVQYSCLGGSATLLHRALHRAASIAPTSQILVTALEEYRDQWEPILWSVRPQMRFVGDKRTSPLLASAAAILSIARIASSAIVTILPARCYVAHEWILRQALRQVGSELPHIPEGVAALGMVDIDEGVDEDYLVLSHVRTGRGLPVQGIARRPTAWVARHLRRQGAVVSSGIMIGHASTFAAHIWKHWPGISQRITRLAAMAGAAQRECEIPNSLQDRVPGAILKSLRWHPPAFPQRVFTVCDSGWSGLKSPHAVTRIVEFMANQTHRRRHQLISPPTTAHHGAPIAL